MTLGMIAALDAPDPDKARSWAAAIGQPCGVFKIGLEFCLANGAARYRAVVRRPIFLDLETARHPDKLTNAVQAVLRAALRPGRRWWCRASGWRDGR